MTFGTDIGELRSFLDRHAERLPDDQLVPGTNNVWRADEGDRELGVTEFEDAVFVINWITADERLRGIRSPSDVSIQRQPDRLRFHTNGEVYEIDFDAFALSVAR